MCYVEYKQGEEIWNNVKSMVQVEDAALDHIGSPLIEDGHLPKTLRLYRREPIALENICSRETLQIVLKLPTSRGIY